MILVGGLTGVIGVLVLVGGCVRVGVRVGGVVVAVEVGTRVLVYVAVPEGFGVTVLTGTILVLVRVGVRVLVGVGVLVGVLEGVLDGVIVGVAVCADNIDAITIPIIKAKSRFILALPRTSTG